VHARLLSVIGTSGTAGSRPDPVASGDRAG
jgi:hypothetical protein